MLLYNIAIGMLIIPRTFMSEVLCMRFPHSWNFLKTRDTHRISRFKVLVPDMLLYKESMRKFTFVLKMLFLPNVCCSHCAGSRSSLCLDLALAVSSQGSPVETSKNCGLSGPSSNRCLPWEVLQEVCLRKSSVLEGIMQKRETFTSFLQFKQRR